MPAALVGRARARRARSRSASCSCATSCDASDSGVRRADRALRRRRGGRSVRAPAIRRSARPAGAHPLRRRVHRRDDRGVQPRVGGLDRVLRCRSPSAPAAAYSLSAGHGRASSRGSTATSGSSRSPRSTWSSASGSSLARDRRRPRRRPPRRRPLAARRHTRAVACGTALLRASSCCSAPCWSACPRAGPPGPRRPSSHQLETPSHDGRDRHRQRGGDPHRPRGTSPDLGGPDVASTSATRPSPKASDRWASSWATSASPRRRPRRATTNASSVAGSTTARTRSSCSRSRRR